LLGVRRCALSDNRIWRRFAIAYLLQKPNDHHGTNGRDDAGDNETHAE